MANDNISIKHNLLALSGAGVMNIKGGSGNLVKCLVIPIEKAMLYEGEKGIYLDTTGIPLKEKRNKDTHLIKQVIPKPIYATMTDEEKKAQPIIGNLIVWGESGSATTGGETKSTTVTAAASESDLNF